MANGATTAAGIAQGGMHAYLLDTGRVWVESVNSLTGKALIRFDPSLGMRGKRFSVPLDRIDFTREWKFR